MIRVGLNLVFLVPGLTGGMETYARELVPRLAAREDLHVTAFVNREAAGEDLGADEQVSVGVRATNRLEWVRGEQQLLPGLAERAGCELVHSLASTAPLRGRFVRVTTIHDLLYLFVPETHFGLRGLGMRVLVPAAARRSHRIIAVSEATRQDLARHLRVRGDKVDVVPQAGTDPVVAGTGEAELRRRLGLGDRRVLLSVSAKRPHKNLSRLLDAVAVLPRPRPVVVVPGYPTPYEQHLRQHAASLGVSGDVLFLDWVTAADLEGLYAICDGAVFPSLYEGFGLPVLDAMARGVPVATSARGSLAEVAGGAALTFDPEDVGAMAAAMTRLLDDRDEAARLRGLGLERAAAFSWDRTAALTADVYRRAMSRSR